VKTPGVCALDTLTTKILQGMLRMLAQAFFCCRRPVTSVIPLRSVSLLKTFAVFMTADNFAFVGRRGCRLGSAGGPKFSPSFANDTANHVTEC